ncbi:hypothetical protein B0F90DRAFT_1212787 [Multifurca ochricompacta]|uniref:Uncharacterized protein n=1 Tax=Multifurca ochricompacta TaxID=376703 RepID=A0AAD4LYI6_9AGAM|nr:hypothetical protein B0F90DRAFT_1212787 [Multifurca ochricompacta]
MNHRACSGSVGSPLKCPAQQYPAQLLRTFGVGSAASSMCAYLYTGLRTSSLQARKMRYVLRAKAHIVASAMGIACLTSTSHHGCSTLAPRTASCTSLGGRDRVRGLSSSIGHMISLISQAGLSCRRFVEQNALKKLDGRTGPNGEELHIALSRLPAVHPSRLWRWVCAEEGMRGRGEWEDREEGYFEVEWSGLGFGTGAEGNDTALELGSGSGSGVSSTSRSPVGTRGGRTSWKVSDQQANAEAASSVLVIGPRHRHHGMTSEVWKDDEVEEALRDSPPKLVEQSDTSPTTTTLSQRLLARMDSEGQDSDDSPRLLG